MIMITTQDSNYICIVQFPEACTVFNQSFAPLYFATLPSLFYQYPSTF